MPAPEPVLTAQRTRPSPAAPPLLAALDAAPQPLVVAHRGDPTSAPENTLPALARAVALGADMVEADVRLTADGVPVLLHDATLDRTTTGRGPVGELTSEQLVHVDAGGRCGPAFAGTPVPTLAAALRLLREAGVPMLLELKPPMDRVAVSRVLREVRLAGMCELVLVQSFDRAVVAWARQAEPAVARGLLVTRVPRDLSQVAAGLGLVACNPAALPLLADRGGVERLRKLGLRVLPYTVNAPRAWEALHRRGVTGLITDRPGHLRAWLAHRGQPRAV